MDTLSPLPCVYRTYAFTAEGKKDTVHAKAVNSNITNSNNVNDSNEAPMTPSEFADRLRHIAPARGNRFAGDLHDTCMVIERSKNLNLVLYTANLLDGSVEGGGGAAVDSGKGRRAVINAKDPLRTYWLKLEPEHVARRRARGEMEDICDLNYIEKKLAYGCTASRLPADKAVSELTSLLKKSTIPVTPEQAKIVAEWDAFFGPCTAKYVAAPQWPVLMLTLPPLVDAAEGQESEDAATAPAVTAASPLSADSEHNKAGEEEGTKASVKKDVGGDSATAPGFAPADTVTVMLAVIDGQLSLLKKVYVTSIEPKHFYQLPSVVSLEAFGVSVATGESTYGKLMNK